MLTQDQLQRKLGSAFEPAQAALLAEVVTEAYAELVKTHDFNELKEIVRDLAQAQVRTEESVRQLSEEMRDVKRQLGGLSTTVGYRLEDEAYRALPDLLLQDHQLTVQGRLKRGYVANADGRNLEINILGDALRGSETVKIIGECKSQLSIPNIDRFIRRQLTPLQAVYGNIFPLLVTYMVSSPEVEAYAQEQGIALYYSYEFLDK
jgi:hypothetical protein